MQCLRKSVETGERWPHIPNALKYTSAIIVIAVGVFQPSVRTYGTLPNVVWVIFFVLATCYQYVKLYRRAYAGIVFRCSYGYV